MNQYPVAPLWEQSAPIETPGRFSKAVAATAAVLALSGCTDGTPDVKTSAAPADTRPAVTASASYEEQYPAQVLLDTTGISAPLDQAIKAQESNASAAPSASPAPNSLPGWQTLDNTWPNGTKDYSFPLQTSAPLLEVKMAADGSLRYTDQTGGTMRPEDIGFLLGTVQHNNELVKGSMSNGNIDSIRFRIFEPNQFPDNPELEPSEYPLFLPKDYTDAANGNVYYFLPASGILDQEATATMERHELIHGALKHGIDKITPEDTAVLADACDTLRTAALQEATSYAYDIADRLVYLRDHSDNKYASSFNTVIRAINNGDYRALPLAKDLDDVIECFIQNPIGAVYQTAKHKGVNTKQLDEDLFEKNANTDVTTAVVDDWNGLLDDQTIYSQLREAAYLKPSGEDPDKRGHPYQGAHEVMTSFLNVTLSFPEEAAYKLIGTDAKQLDAIDTIVRKSIGLIKQKNNDPQLNMWLDVRYGMFKKELDGIR